VLEITFPYDPYLVAEVKAIDGRRWDGQRRIWTAPLSHRMVEEFDRFVERGKFTLSPEAGAAVTALREETAARRATETALEAASRSAEADLHVEGLGGVLRPFQRAGVAYALQTRRTFIGDEQGLGKTVEALATIEAAGAYPALVLCPATLKPNWRREIAHWLPHVKVLMLDTAKLRSGRSFDLLYHLQRLRALDPKMGTQGVQERQDVQPPGNDPAVLVPPAGVAGRVRAELPNGTVASDGLQPLHERDVRVVDAHDPSLPSSRNVADDRPLAVEDAGHVPEGGRVGGDSDAGGHGGAGSVPTGGAPAQEPAQPVAVDAMLAGDLGHGLTLGQPMLDIDQSGVGPLPKDTHDHKYIVVCNYDQLVPLDSLLSSVKWQAMVADESHYLKTPTARRTKSALKLAETGIPMRLLLTGTPVVNRPEELIAQLRIIDRLDDMGGINEFRSRYVYGMRLDELNVRLRQTCYIRRLKKDVLTELPPKMRVVQELAIDNWHEYERARDDVIGWIEERASADASFLATLTEFADDEEGIEARKKAVAAHASDAGRKASRAEALVRIGALKYLVAKGKMAGAIAWVKDFLESGEKLVLFAHNVDLQHELAAAFPGCARILGTDDPTVRQQNVDRFQSDDRCRLIVCSFAAGGVGITLTAASNVAFLQLGWTPAGHDQAEDRTHRIGQLDSVTAWYLLGAGTIDETIADLIDEKRKVVTAATDGGTVDETSLLSALMARMLGRSA
jgi:hypothetical protein